VDLMISSAILIAMLLMYGIRPGWAGLWAIPLLLLQTTLTVAVVLIGSATLVFFRDVRFVIPLLTQIWMYASPVIYPVSIVPERYSAWYFWNPMAGIIEGYRNALLADTPPDAMSILPGTAVTLVLLVGGYLFFKRAEPVFADLI